MQQTNTQRQKRRACFIWDSLIVSVFAFCFVLSYSFDCNLWCSQVSQGRASCRLRPQGCLIWHIPKVSLLKSQVQAIITCRLKPSPVMTQINYCFIFKDYQYLEQCRELKKIRSVESLFFYFFFYWCIRGCNLAFFVAENDVCREFKICNFLWEAQLWSYSVKF